LKVKVSIDIAADGKMTVNTVKGATQVGCQGVADLFAKAVGEVDEKSRKTTDDYYSPMEQQQDINATS
jgi:hypothetical protein